MREFLKLFAIAIEFYCDHDRNKTQSQSRIISISYFLRKHGIQPSPKHHTAVGGLVGWLVGLLVGWMERGGLKLRTAFPEGALVAEKSSFPKLGTGSCFDRTYVSFLSGRRRATRWATRAAALRVSQLGFYPGANAPELALSASNRGGGGDEPHKSPGGGKLTYPRALRIFRDIL